MPLQKNYYLTIPLKNRDMAPMFVVVEEDLQGNKLNITLTHDGVPFDLTGTDRVTFTCLKADGNAVVDEATIEDAKTGKISYVLHQQCMTCPGIVQASIEVFSEEGTARITSTQFSFEVRKQLDDGTSIPSEEEYQILQQLIVDTTKVVNTEHKGEYDPETEYKKNNIVSFFGSSYMAIQDTIGNPPADETYWKPIGLKGDRGAILIPRGEYSALASYVKDDLVLYNGNSYYCLKDCTGIPPTNEEYWQLFVGGEVEHDYLAGLNEGDYQHLTQDQKKSLVAKSIYHTATGSNEIIITTGQDFAYVQGNWVKWIQEEDNNGAATINVDSKGAKPLVNPDGTALVAGDLEEGNPYEAFYDAGNDFFVLRPRGAKLDGIIEAIEAWGGMVEEPKKEAEVIEAIQDVANWDSDLVSENLRRGKTVLGIYGTLDPMFYIASDNVKAEANTQRWTHSKTYVPLKQIRINGAGGTVRVKFQFHVSYSDDMAYARVYKNSVPISSEYSTRAVVPGEVYSLDIAVAPGDIILMYAKVFGSSSAAYIDTFRICFDVVNSTPTVVQD